MEFIRIEASDIELKPFHKLDKEWALLSAGNKEKFNTMTVSWGFLGTMWNLPAVTVFTRPSRYTLEFLEREEYFSLCFLDLKYKKQLAYLGVVSGRNEDKIAKSGLAPAFDDYTGAPYFSEAPLVLICRKIYSDNIKEGNFISEDLITKNYPLKDFHRFYMGEVVEVLKAAAKNNF